MTTAFQVNAFQNNAFQILNVPIVFIDTHDGGPKRRKQEAEKRKKRRQEIIDLFEQIVEGKPLIAEQIAAPFVKEATISNIKSINWVKKIDFDALMDDLVKVQQLYDAYIEMDDEEVLALL